MQPGKLCKQKDSERGILKWLYFFFLDLSVYLPIHLSISYLSIYLSIYLLIQHVFFSAENWILALYM
jgi:hypothetical protein